MTQEEIEQRLTTIIDHLFDAVGGDMNTPLCEVLNAELTETEHENIHAIFNTLTALGMSYGFSMARQFTAMAFVYGRKWGLMEASEGMTLEVPDVGPPPEAT